MSAPLKWSNSALACLERCGEQFRRRYIEKERVPPAPKMIRGTAVHRVASTSMLRKMETQEIPSTEEAKDLAADFFEVEWAGGVTFEQEQTEESVAATKATSKDFAVDLSAFYVEELAPAINPVAVERHITVKPKDSDLVIHGTIDLIDAAPGGEQIRDIKTSEKSPSKDVAEKSQQLTMYAMIRLAEKGELPAGLTLDYLVRTPARAERKHVPLRTTRDQGDVVSMVNRINTAVEAVKRGVFVPTSTENWWCSRQWCEYWSTCVYVRRGPDRPQS
jgi:RecB family exonuclease